MVGAGRLELPTSCTPSKRASQTAPRPGPVTNVIVSDAGNRVKARFDYISMPGGIGHGPQHVGMMRHPEGGA